MKINIHTHSPKQGELTLSTLGIHPYDAERATTDSILSIERMAQGVDAIGEIGLDYSCKADRESQELIFKAQLEVAQQYGKGVVLHCVRAFEPTMKILEKYRLKFVIFHGFIGSLEQALSATSRGYYLSFGERTFRSPKSIEAMKATPIDRLFFETDESSVDIEEIYSKAAEVLAVPVKILEYITHENFKHICG